MPAWSEKPWAVATRSCLVLDGLPGTPSRQAKKYSSDIATLPPTADVRLKTIDWLLLSPEAVRRPASRAWRSVPALFQGFDQLRSCRG